MKALLLAGGQGVRLRSIIKDIPKPMAPVAGKPFLEYLILQLKYYGIMDIVLSVGYLFHTIQDYFGNGNQLGVTIEYSIENQPLGTGGAIKQAERYLRDQQMFFVMNGDSFFDANFHKLRDIHLENQALVTLSLVAISDASRYGTVRINESGRIFNFCEKKSNSSGLINAGVYAVSPAIFDIIPFGNVSFEREILAKCCHLNLFGMKDNGFFIDIGMPEDFSRISGLPDKLIKK